MFYQGKVEVCMGLFGLFQKPMDESVEMHNDLEIQILKSEFWNWNLSRKALM